MDYTQIRYFLLLAEYKSMTLAARQVPVSEQALGKSIHKLEDELQVKLVKREEKGFSLTPEGDTFVTLAKGYAAHHEYLLSQTRMLHDREKPHLSIGIAAGTAERWLPRDFLPDFIAAHPEADFELTFFTDDKFNQGQQFASRDIILTSAVSCPENWLPVAHRQRELTLLINRNSPLCDLEAIRVKDLIGMKVAIADEDTMEQTKFIAAMAQYGIRPAVRFGPSEVPLIHELVKKAGYVSLYAGDETELAPELTTRPFQDISCVWNFNVLVRKNVPASPVQGELVAAMKRCI